MYLENCSMIQISGIMLNKSARMILQPQQRGHLAYCIHITMSHARFQIWKGYWSFYTSIDRNQCE